MDDLLATDPRANPQALLQTPPGGLPLSPLSPPSRQDSMAMKGRDELEKSFARIADALCNTQTPEMTHKRDELRLRERESFVAETEQKRKHDREDLDLLLQAKRAKDGGDDFTYQAILLSNPGVKVLFDKIQSDLKQ